MWNSEKLEAPGPGNNEPGGRVIEAAIAVHTASGPGPVEAVHENALAVELSMRSIRFERQEVIRIFHREAESGEHRLDLPVEACLWGEFMAEKEIEDIFYARGRSQMKAVGISDGLILNFASMPLTIKRIGPGFAAS